MIFLLDTNVLSDILRRNKAVTALIANITPVPWDSAVAALYGQLKADLQNNRQPLSDLDMMIAAHAMATGLCLVTSDKAFSRIQGLESRNWRTAPGPSGR